MQDLAAWKADAKQADEALHRLDVVGMSKARSAAQAALDALMLTDAPLLYSPSLMALAALRAGFRKVLCDLMSACMSIPDQTSSLYGLFSTRNSPVNERNL